MSANDTQIGGDHYQSKAVQPWEAMEAWLTKEQFIGFLRGNALKYLGQREKGAERLEQAVVAYTDALKVYGRDPMPLDWALVQINRATVHIQFFDKTGDFDHLQTASTHINSALEVLKEAEASLYIAVAEQISAKIDALSKGSDQS